MKNSMLKNRGFTLLEVLVALVIVGTALGASLRAVGSLTQNSDDLRAAMMAHRSVSLTNGRLSVLNNSNASKVNWLCYATSKFLPHPILSFAASKSAYLTASTRDALLS
jgi:type II secretion system protein I